MDRTFSRNFDARESAQQALSDFTGTPARVLRLHMENIVLYLKRQLVRIVMGSTAAVGQSLHPTFLVAIEDLVTGFAGDAELPAQFRHRLARNPATHKLNSFVHNRTFLPRHSLPPSSKKGKSVTHVSGTNCHPCVRSVTRYARPLFLSALSAARLRISPKSDGVSMEQDIAGDS